MVHLITHQTNSRHPNDLFILLTDFPSLSKLGTYEYIKKNKKKKQPEGKFKCELMMNG